MSIWVRECLLTEFCPIRHSPGLLLRYSFALRRGLELRSLASGGKSGRWFLAVVAICSWTLDQLQMVGLILFSRKGFNKWVTGWRLMVKQSMQPNHGGYRMILLPLTYGKNPGFPQDKTSSYIHEKIISSKTWNGIPPVTVKLSLLLGGVGERILVLHSYWWTLNYVPKWTFIIMFSALARMHEFDKLSQFKQSSLNGVWWPCSIQVS